MKKALVFLVLTMLTAVMLMANDPPFTLDSWYCQPYTCHDDSISAVRDGVAEVWAYGNCTNGQGIDGAAYSGVQATNCTFSYYLKADGNYLTGKTYYKGLRWPLEGVYTNAYAVDAFTGATVWEMNDGADCTGWHDGVMDPPISPC